MSMRNDDLEMEMEISKLIGVVARISRAVVLLAGVWALVYLFT